MSDSVVLVSRCGSLQEFVAAFRRYAERIGLFVPTIQPLQVGRHVAIQLTLANGEVAISGHAEVIASSQLPGLQGRPGMTLRLTQLDAPSQSIFSFLQSVRYAPSVPSVPEGMSTRPGPSVPRPLPGTHKDPVFAAAECDVVGDATARRPQAAIAPVSVPAKVPSIATKLGPGVAKLGPTPAAAKGPVVAPAAAKGPVVPPAAAKGPVVPPAAAKGPVVPPAAAKGPVAAPVLKSSLPTEGTRPSQTPPHGVPKREPGQALSPRAVVNTPPRGMPAVASPTEQASGAVRDINSQHATPAGGIAKPVVADPTSAALAQHLQATAIAAVPTEDATVMDAKAFASTQAPRGRDEPKKATANVKRTMLGMPVFQTPDQKAPQSDAPPSTEPKRLASTRSASPAVDGADSAFARPSRPSEMAPAAASRIDDFAPLGTQAISDNDLALCASVDLEWQDAPSRTEDAALAHADRVDAHRANAARQTTVVADASGSTSAPAASAPLVHELASAVPGLRPKTPLPRTVRPSLTPVPSEVGFAATVPVVSANMALAPNRRRLAMVAGAVTLFVLVGVVGYWVMRRPAQNETRSSDHSAPATSDTAKSVAKRVFDAAPTKGITVTEPPDGRPRASFDATPAVRDAPAAPSPEPTPAPKNDGASVADVPAACSLELTSTPSKADVVIGGKSRGKTPLRIELPCETVAVTLRHPQRVSATQKIKPTAKGTKRSITLAPIMMDVKVSSKPTGASVMVGGKQAGKTPTTIKVPGFVATKVTFEKVGFATTTETVTAKQNGTAVQATLKKK